LLLLALVCPIGGWFALPALSRWFLWDFLEVPRRWPEAASTGFFLGLLVPLLLLGWAMLRHRQHREALLESQLKSEVAMRETRDMMRAWKAPAQRQPVERVPRRS
jgi:hypothetical protein